MAAIGGGALAVAVSLLAGPGVGIVAGGLGGPALLALASAGVGRLVLLDDDAVETSNLNRQPLFGQGDLGTRKAAVAARRLGQLFPGVKVDAQDRRFDDASAFDPLPPSATRPRATGLPPCELAASSPARISGTPCASRSDVS